jgi:hypothetical protein
MLPLPLLLLLLLLMPLLLCHVTHLLPALVLLNGVVVLLADLRNRYCRHRS